MPSHRSDCPALLVVATALEAKAVLVGFALDWMAWSSARPADELLWMPRPISGGLDLVLTGIGKSNAAAATALSLARRDYHAVVSIGIAGSLPDSPARVGDIVVATESVYADEGLLSPLGFQTCAEMGFPIGPFSGNRVPVAARLLDPLATVVDHAGPIATVSTCSGTDSLAANVRARTGAVAECMEGAAVGHVVASWAAYHLQHTSANPTPAFAEVRAISNTTGDRSRQIWNMKLALDSLARAASSVANVLAAS